MADKPIRIRGLCAAESLNNTVKIVPAFLGDSREVVACLLHYRVGPHGVSF